MGPYSYLHLGVGIFEPGITYPFRLPPNHKKFEGFDGSFETYVYLHM